MAKKRKTQKNKKLKRGSWSAAEISLLERQFPDISCNKIAQKLGRPFYAVKRKAYRLGICKSKSYLKSIGRA
ncbi:MAG: hypothetical protein JW749_05905 [Sedimentisphaerales bacterium]|nr:hypothetical protein [Sedimentisphaerales bacterium]